MARDGTKKFTIKKKTIICGLQEIFISHSLQHFMMIVVETAVQRA